MVPRNDKDLVAVPPERVRRLREHLINELRDLRKAAHLERFASPAQPEPPALAARVARTACSLCKGWCCRNGDDDAFQMIGPWRSVRLSQAGHDGGAVLRLSLDRGPNVCNSYSAGGLGAYMKTDAAVPTKVIAGEGDKMRTSPVLMP